MIVAVIDFNENSPIALPAAMMLVLSLLIGRTVDWSNRYDASSSTTPVAGLGRTTFTGPIATPVCGKLLICVENRSAQRSGVDPMEDGG